MKSENFNTKTTIKQSLNSKKMKNNYLKLGVFSLMMLAGAAAQAQQISGDFDKIEDASKSQELDGTIRVIDNKGTKKYLQVKNGLTLLTNTTPAGGIVSTWQLGGSLTDNTYIDATGKTFSLDGLKLVNGLTTPAALSSTSESIGSNQESITGSGTVSTETGWTVLIRDEATGEIQKMVVSDLVTLGHNEVTATSAQASFPALGLPVGHDKSKVSVYRNGIKLRSNIDYNTTIADQITLTNGSATPNDWEVYAGDILEVHWVY